MEAAGDASQNTGATNGHAHAEKEHARVKSAETDGDSAVHLGCFSVSSRMLLLLACTAGIYVAYILYGIAHEALYRPDIDGTQINATAYLLLLQCSANAVIAAAAHAVQRFFTNTRSHAYSKLPTNEATAPQTPDDASSPSDPSVTGCGVPWARRMCVLLTKRDILVLAAIYIASMYASNAALVYVSYPAQVLVKSCKMVPVLLARVCVLRQPYPALKYVCVGLMTAGIVLFNASQPSEGGDATGLLAAFLSDSGIGLAFVVVSVCLDGASAAVQERIGPDFHVSEMEQMYVTNLMSALYMLPVSAAYGELYDATVYLATHPRILLAAALFCLTSGLGQIAVFLTFRCFDTLTLATITTTRKFFTILASVLVHGTSMNTGQWVAVAIVFTGLGLEHVKKRPSKPSA